MKTHRTSRAQKNAIKKKIATTEKTLQILNARLLSRTFLEKAPKKAIEETKAQHKTALTLKARLQEALLS